MRRKLALVLLGVIAAVAVSATPAFANFESAKLEGPGNQLGSGVLTITGGTVTCTGATTTWTLTATNTSLKIESLLKVVFTGCTASVAGVKTEAKVSECNFELEAESKEVANGSVIKNSCVVTVPALKGCEVTVPVSGNTHLKSVATGNSKAGNTLAKVSVGGITYTATAACTGITGGKAGTLKAEFELEGQKVV